MEISFEWNISRMSDQRITGDNSSWNAKFYHQYLQQHTRMTRWIQNIHQNIPQHWQNSSDYQNHAYHNYHLSNTCSHNDHQYQHQPVSQQGNYIPQQRHHDRHERQQKLHGNSRYNTLDMNHSTIYKTNAVNVEDNESDEPEVKNESDDSGEWVLNVEPFITFRAENAKSEKEEKTSAADDDDDSKSNDSIEFLDAVLDENFEFVQLDDVGQVQKVYGKPDKINVKEDDEFDREKRIVQYGDAADRIAEKEASMKTSFDLLNSVNQPVVFPII